MNGLYMLALMAFLGSAFWLLSEDLVPSERDDRDVREQVEQQKEDEHYAEPDEPFDWEREIATETGGPC